MRVVQETMQARVQLPAHQTANRGDSLLTPIAVDRDPEGVSRKTTNKESDSRRGCFFGGSGEEFPHHGKPALIGPPTTFSERVARSHDPFLLVF